MLRNVTDITSKIHQKLKARSEAITVYPDGIGMDGVGSMRISNIPRNIQSNLITSLKILLLFSYYVDAGHRYNPYFERQISSPNNKTHYRLGSQGIDLNEFGNCGTISTDVDYGTYGYQEVFYLHVRQLLVMGKQGYSVSLNRGRGEPINEEIENCFKNLAQSQITYNEIFEYYMILSIPLIFCLCFIINSINLSFFSNNQNQEREPSNNNNSHGRNQLFFNSSSKNLNHSDALTLEERLDKTNFNKNIPDRFICPVTQTIMTNPCITDDGHNYERSVLEKLKNKACPLNPHFKINNIIPNYDLRSEILTYVEKQENLYKLKSKKSYKK